MSEREPHSNPWAEKLLQATLPDGGEAWTAMESLLDREMPVREKKDRRRWLLLILLLLLIIGICNCPGRGRLSQNHPAEPAEKPAEPARSPEPARSGKPTRPEATLVETADGHPAASGGGRDSGTTGPVHHPAKKKATHPNPPDPGRNPPDPVRNAPRAFGDVQEKTTAPDSPRKKPGTPDSVQKKPVTPDSTRKKSAAKDSLRKKPPAPPKEDKEKESEKGFVAAIGLNQFFPVGGQQVSDFNSGGITGTLGDYIPVPVVRYYFSKRLYIQLEAQFNAPQYTKKDLVVNTAKPDTLAQGRVSSTTASIRKLLYFNVPLSVHYAPIDGLSLGAGLQFSRLRNAFGSFDTTIRNTVVTPIDSVIGKRESTLKGSTIYQNISTNEFRFLVDVNYTYKHFILGLRYNQALSKFINVTVGPGNVTQSRNNSLQLYLRYILWDERKKTDGTKSGPYTRP